jgi:hypothetical protein
MCTIGLRYAQRNPGCRRDRNLHRVLDERTKTLLKQAAAAELSLGQLRLQGTAEQQEGKAGGR